MIQATSIKAYREILEEGLLGHMEERLFKLILTYPCHSDRELAEIGHLKINQVTGRRNGLVDQGCVEDAGVRLDSETGRTVHIWQIVPVINYRPKPKQPKEAQKSLKKYIKVRS
jgi:hypothetical protein